MSVLGRVGRPVMAGLAHVLSIPVYFGYEGIVRLANLRRGRDPLADDVVRLMQPFFDGVDLSTVRIVHPARIPSARSSTSGLTLGSTIYLKVEPDPSSLRAMRLLLHELVHVRQGSELGRSGFARSYGVGWARHLSYRHNPLEAEAFDYEDANRATLTAALGRPPDDRT